MHENNFEKEVRQKIEELSFEPSAPVWLQVEERIKRKQRRRRFVFWLFPLLLLTGSAVWWLSSTRLYKGEEEISTTATSAPYDVEKKSEHKEKLSKEETQSSDKAIVEAPSASTPESGNINTATGNYNPTNIPFVKDNNREKRKLKKEKAIIATSQTTAFKTNRETSPPSERSVAINKKDQKENSLVDNKTTPTLPSSKPLTESGNTAVTQKAQDSVRTDSTRKKPVDTAKVAEPVAVQPAKAKKNKKLQFGIQASIGFSGVSTGLFNGFGQKSAQDVAMPVPNTQAGGNVNAAPILPPSVIKNGLSYAVGASVGKQLSVRSRLSVGIQYQHYSTSIQVGTRTSRDSLLNRFSADAGSYYRNNNQQNDYTNQYHYAKLPVLYEYQLLKKVPLHAGVGVSIGRLLSSNALHYNRTANIYYRNDSLLNKTSADLTAALTYELLRTNKFSVQVGPQFQYGLRPLTKGSGSTAQHLYAVSVAARLQF